MPSACAGSSARSPSPPPGHTSPGRPRPPSIAERYSRGMRFRASRRDGGRGRVLVPVPFDAAEVWTAKPRHHVNGTLDGKFVRGIIERHGEEWGFLLGPAWVRDCGAVVAKRATVVIEAE